MKIALVSAAALLLFAAVPAVAEDSALSEAMSEATDSAGETSSELFIKRLETATAANNEAAAQDATRAGSSYYGQPQGAGRGPLPPASANGFPSSFPVAGPDPMQKTNVIMRYDADKYENKFHGVALPKRVFNNVD